MERGLTSLDILALVDELREMISGARVDRIYLLDDEIRIRIYTKQGAQELVVIPGKSMHLTNYRKEATTQPPPFAMQLRKYLSGRILRDIKQHEFDRIVELVFDENTLVIELFSKGNAILLDQERKILGLLKRQVWKDRRLIHGELYSYPPSFSANPVELDLNPLRDMMASNNTEIVRFIAKNLGFGGVYSEEFCSRFEIDKTSPVSSFDPENLLKNIKSFIKSFTEERRPNIVLGEVMNFFPIDMKLYENVEKKFFRSFTEAIDEYYANYYQDAVLKRHLERQRKEREKIEVILKNQMEQLEKFKRQEHENQKKADIIMYNYKLVDEILTTLKKAREKYTWQEIKRIIQDGKEKGNPIASLILEINEKDGYIIVDLPEKFQG